MKNMRKRWGAALVLLAAALLGSSFLAFADETEGPGVSMEVSAVYGDAGKLGCHIPLNIKLYGQSEEPFSGSVRVRTMENGSDVSEEIYEYSYPVTVTMAETKDLEIYVPLGQRSNEIYVSLAAGTGNEIDRKTLAFDVSRDVGRLVIGGLSEEMEKIRFLDGVNLNYGLAGSLLLPMEEETFPKDARGLELLDLLVINHYETEKLSEGQREAILKWVEDGGVLLFGTGDMAYEVLAPFYSDFYGLSIVGSRKESVGFGVEYAKEEPGDSNLSMVCTDLWIPGGTEVMESDGQPLLTMVNRGKGSVGFFSYDLGDINGFVGENPEYAARILTEALGEEAISQLYYYSSYQPETEYWNAQSMVNTGSTKRLPNIPLYVAAAAAYILAAGPGLFYFLKKRDLGRHYGKAVVAASVAASAVIYLMGTGTRFTTEFYTVASVLDVGEDTVAETSYLNIRTPDSRPFSLEIPGEYEIVPLTRSSRYQETGASGVDKKKNASLGIQYGEDGTVISSRRLRAFEPKYFRLEKESAKEFPGNVEGELTVFDGKLSGYLVNGYSFPLTDGFLLLYGQMYPLGTLEPGEKRVFEEEELLVWPVNMPYLISERTGEKNSLSSYFISMFYGSYTDEARIAAFGPENGLWNVVSAEGRSTEGQILYTSRISLQTERDGLIYRSGFLHKPVVNSGSGSIYSDGMAMYSGEPVSVEYSLGTDIDVERISFLPVSEELLSGQEYYYLRIFEGEAWFYNRETRIYDSVDLSRAAFTKAELAPYLSAENGLIVKYTAGDMDSTGVSTLLPVLMVTGRER